MSKKTITFYANTGFNSVDVPESIELVEDNANRVLTLHNYNIIQTNNLAEILVSGLSEEDCNQIDYVVIEDDDNKTGYILQDRGFEFRADNTIRFFLIRDSFATMGGLRVTSGNTLIYCTAERCHVSDDDKTYYTEVEPFTPAERCHIIEGINGISLDPNMSEEVYNILETVVAPPKLVSNLDGASKPTVTVGKVKLHTGTAYETPDGKLQPVSNASNALFSVEGANTGEQVTIVANDETKDPIAVNKSVLITPLFRKITKTLYTIGKLFAGEITINTGTMWWNGDNMESSWTDVMGNVHPCGVLRDLRVAGAENGAVAFWAVNKNYVESMSDAGYSATSDSAGGITSIKSKTFNNTAIFTTTLLEYKNNKIYYGQALTIKVFSPISGEEITKQAYEIRNPELTPAAKTSRADYSISADIRSGGSPIFCWKYINGEEQTAGFVETINGGKWRQIPLAAVGNPGSAYETLQLEKDKNNKMLVALTGSVAAGLSGAKIGSMIGSVIPGVGNVVGGIAGGIIGGIAGGVGTYAAQTKLQAAQQELLDAKGEIADVALSVSTSEYLREIGKNSFYNIFSIYSENDIKAFDRFLTLYGYKVNNKVLTDEDFYSRPSFNFIRANDIAIQSNYHSMRLVNEVRDQLKAGIRIWHEMPNSEAIETGNKASD